MDNRSRDPEEERESPETRRDRPEERRPYHDDKGDEKEEEKKEEKGRGGEKGPAKGGFYGEKWARDTLTSVTWGLIVVWVGIVFLIGNLDIGGRLAASFRSGNWAWILLGAGVLVLLEVILRLVIPEYRRPLRGRLFLGLILFVIGLGGIINLDITWPVIIIAVGILLLVSTVMRPTQPS